MSECTWGPVLPREMFFPLNEGEDFDRWTGTERAMLSKHPDKFSKEACKTKGKKGGKMCPYAITASMEKKGAEPHYKKQESSKKGKPKKKDDYKNETTIWDRWITFKENNMSCQCNCKDCKNGNCKSCTCPDCKCDGCKCS